MPRFSHVLLDHARSPRNAGRMHEPDRIGEASLDGSAPRVTIQLRIVGDHVVEARFLAFGCGVTIAACSMLTEMIRGRHVHDLQRLEPGDVIDALDGMPSDKAFCADLAVAALRDALE
jgi:NifU-like protein involved in Fe-S cluster formation